MEEVDEETERARQRLGARSEHRLGASSGREGSNGPRPGIMTLQIAKLAVNESHFRVPDHANRSDRCLHHHPSCQPPPMSIAWDTCLCPRHSSLTHARGAPSPSCVQGKLLPPALAPLDLPIVGWLLGFLLLPHHGRCRSCSRRRTRPIGPPSVAPVNMAIPPGSAQSAAALYELGRRKRVRPHRFPCRPPR